jgi:hypothetical protein
MWEDNNRWIFGGKQVDRTTRKEEKVFLIPKYSESFFSIDFK